MNAAQRTKALLDAGYLTEDMQITAVKMGLLTRADCTPAVQAKIDNYLTIRSQAQTAMTGNTTYLALASPTAAQNTAQVKALTRQNNAMIRLLLGLLDGTN